MNLSGIPQITAQQTLSDSSTAQWKVGDKGYTRDGREFRYVLNGASALVAGNMIQSPAQIANHQQLTAVAAAVGATSLSAALGATLSTLNQYYGGLAVIDTTPGEGYGYAISGHLAILSSGTGVFNLDQSDTIQVALTTSSRVTLQANPYSGVIQTPVTTLTGAVVGAAVYPIAIASYGWICTGGITPVLGAGTPAVGQSLSCPTTAAGAVAINSGTLAIVGQSIMTGVDGKIFPILLHLP